MIGRLRQAGASGAKEMDGSLFQGEILLNLDTEDDDELSRRFDLLILTYQLALLTGTGNKNKYTGNIYNIAKALEKKDNIPQIASHLNLIKEIQTDTYWQNINVKKLEELRQSLRDLIKYLEGKRQEPVYTNFQDEIDLSEVRTGNPITPHTPLQSYRNRVERYIRENKHHLTISKIRNNVPITKDELRSIVENYYKNSNINFKKETGVKFLST